MELSFPGSESFKNFRTRGILSVLEQLFEELRSMEHFLPYIKISRK